MMTMISKIRWTWMMMLLALVLSPACESMRKPSLCRNPKYVEVMKEQAVAFYNSGNYIEAYKNIKDAEACKPKDPEVYYLTGMINFKRGKSYDAIESFQKSLSLDPDYTKSRMFLGVVYLDLQRWDDAIREFEAATKDDFYETPWLAYNNLGWAYLQKGELALAEVNIKQAIKLNKNFCPAYCNMGELYSKQGEAYRTKAIVNYQKAISLCPKDYARPHFLLAVEYGHMGLYTKACEELVLASRVQSAPEAEQAREYMRLFNCPNVVIGIPGQ
jgi:Tfp pilus assembly protein PilF